jgi:hypothetical protein
MRPLLCCILLSPLTFPAGCAPGVGWLPDSSGFVFVGGTEGKQLLHFDVESGKTKVILDDAKTNTLWPAVSPDGKTIALAHLSGKGHGPSTLQVRLLNLEGKELSTSAPIVVRKKTGKGIHGNISLRSLPQLFWRPQGDKILINVDMMGLIFDVKAGTFKRTEALGQGPPIVFGPTPITPDGNGFVIFNGEERVYAIKDWDGNLHPLTPDKESVPFFKKLMNEANDSENQPWGIGLFSPASIGGHWAGDKARIRWANLELQIDSKNKTMSGALVKQRMADGKPLDSEYQLKGAVVQFIRLDRPDEQEHFPNGFAYRVRVDVKTKTRRTIIDKADEVVIIPSPDRKLLALRCAIPLKDGDKLTRNDYRDRIVVLNSQGMVVGDWEGPSLERLLLGEKKTPTK